MLNQSIINIGTLYFLSELYIIHAKKKSCEGGNVGMSSSERTKYDAHGMVPVMHSTSTAAFTAPLLLRNACWFIVKPVFEKS